MQPNDFVKTTSQPDLPTNHFHTGNTMRTPYNSNEWFSTPVDCITIVTDIGITTEIVSLHNLYLGLDVFADMQRKAILSNSISDAARAYWRRRSHREYQRTIAQYLQRELELPGEVAKMILAFA